MSLSKSPKLCSTRPKTGQANIILYFTTSAAIKASLLLLYCRYFGISKPFRLALYISAGIVLCWYLSVFFATIFQCIPVAAFWDRTIKNPKCMDLVAFTVGSGVSNLLTDVMILCLPMPMVWFLHTNRTQKFILTGIFCWGSCKSYSFYIHSSGRGSNGFAFAQCLCWLHRTHRPASEDQ